MEEQETRQRLDVRRPAMWTCRFYHDEVTPNSFLVQLLVRIFHQQQTAAQVIVSHIRTAGSATVGVYPKEIAVLKANEAIESGRTKRYPLQVQAVQLGR